MEDNFENYVDYGYVVKEEVDITDEHEPRDIESMLIAEVQKYPQLYNIAHSKYRRIEEKERIWELIGAKLNLEVSIAKKKWKIIRDYFFFAKKGMESPSGSAAPNRKRWKYYDACAFLAEVPKGRIPLCNANEETPPFSITSESEVSLPNDAPSAAPTPSHDGVQKFLLDATTQIQKICENISAAEENSTTTRFMLSMADIIVEADLPVVARLQLKREISELIFAKIEKFKNG